MSTITSLYQFKSNIDNDISDKNSKLYKLCVRANRKYVKYAENTLGVLNIKINQKDEYKLRNDLCVISGKIVIAIIDNESTELSLIVRIHNIKYKNLTYIYDCDIVDQFSYKVIKLDDPDLFTSTIEGNPECDAFQGFNGYNIRLLKYVINENDNELNDVEDVVRFDLSKTCDLNCIAAPSNCEIENNVASLTYKFIIYYCGIYPYDLNLVLHRNINGRAERRNLPDLDFIYNVIDPFKNHSVLLPAVSENKWETITWEHVLLNVDRFTEAVINQRDELISTYRIKETLRGFIRAEENRFYVIKTMKYGVTVTYEHQPGIIKYIQPYLYINDIFRLKKYFNKRENINTLEYPQLEVNPLDASFKKSVKYFLIKKFVYNDDLYPRPSNLNEYIFTTLSQIPARVNDVNTLNIILNRGASNVYNIIYNCKNTPTDKYVDPSSIDVYKMLYDLVNITLTYLNNNNCVNMIRNISLLNVSYDINNINEIRNRMLTSDRIEVINSIIEMTFFKKDTFNPEYLEHIFENNINVVLVWFSIAIFKPNILTRLMNN